MHLATYTEYIKIIVSVYKNAYKIFLVESFWLINNLFARHFVCNNMLEVLPCCAGRT